MHTLLDISGKVYQALAPCMSEGCKAMTRTSALLWKKQQGWQRHCKSDSNGAGQLTHSDLAGGVALGGARRD